MPMLGIAKFYQEIDDKKSVSKWLKEAVRLNPNDDRVLLDAARWKWSRSDADTAKQHIDTAIKINPGSADAPGLRAT